MEWWESTFSFLSVSRCVGGVSRLCLCPSSSGWLNTGRILIASWRTHMLWSEGSQLEFWLQSLNPIWKRHIDGICSQLGIYLGITWHSTCGLICFCWAKRNISEKDEKNSKSGNLSISTSWFCDLQQVIEPWEWALVPLFVKWSLHIPFLSFLKWNTILCKNAFVKPQSSLTLTVKGIFCCLLEHWRLLSIFAGCLPVIPLCVKHGKLFVYKFSFCFLVFWELCSA